MDRSRVNYIVFFALSVLIIFLYTYIFAPPKKPVQQKPVQNEQTSDTGITETEKPIDKIETVSAPPGRLIRIKTPLSTGVIDTAGGRIVEWGLERYKETGDPGSPITNLFKDSPPEFNTVLNLKGIQVPNPIPFEFDGGDEINVSQQKQEITLHWTSPEGIKITKTYEIDPASYLIEQRIEVTNQTGQAVTEKLSIERYGKLHHSSSRGGNSKSFISMVSGDVERKDTLPKEDASTLRGTINWFGFVDKYFMSAFLPEIGGETEVRLRKIPDQGILRAVYTYPSEAIPPGSSSIHKSKLYLGPMDYEVLRSYNLGLEDSIQYGWVGPLARPVLWFLNVLNGVFHNYGISIIVITIIMRLVFLPLTIKSMTSMKAMQVKMQDLKPKMDALKEKYKDDKAKQNSELMKLYTSNGINPLSSLGGCLPMVIQLPVFIALYDVLLYSIELRHSSFLWIADLSEPEFLFKIPGIGIDFRILPLVMGISWYLSQKMTPTTTMGTENQLQMKMMEFMPLIFTVMFWGLPSGLILYWTVSNILSIFQQLYVNRRFASQGRR